MADLDYGYEITIETSGTSDPAETPTNQWQRKPVGGAWVDITGETGETYTVVEGDRNTQIRLVQDFGGAKAPSNGLQVVDKAVASSPCDKGIGSNAINLSTFGPIQASWGEGTKLIITGKDWLKYLSGYSVVFGSGNTPPNFSSDSNSGKDQILYLGKAGSNYVIVTKDGHSWVSTSGTGSWTQTSTNVHGRPSFVPVAARSDGTVVVVQGRTAFSGSGSNITYTTDGVNWVEPATSFPDLGAFESYALSGSNGYFCAEFGDTRYYNLVQGDLTNWGSFDYSKTQRDSGVFGHLGVLWGSNNGYYFYDPWRDWAEFVLAPWLPEAGHGYDVTGVTSSGVCYEGGVYWITASNGVVVSSCNGTDWKLHRSNSFASANLYDVDAAFLANQNKWHLIEAYGRSNNGAVSSIS